MRECGNAGILNRGHALHFAARQVSRRLLPARGNGKEVRFSRTDPSTAPATVMEQQAASTATGNREVSGKAMRNAPESGDRPGAWREPAPSDRSAPLIDSRLRGRKCFVEHFRAP